MEKVAAVAGTPPGKGAAFGPLPQMVKGLGPILIEALRGVSLPTILAGHGQAHGQSQKMQSPRKNRLQ